MLIDAAGLAEWIARTKPNLRMAAFAAAGGGSTGAPGSDRAAGLPRPDPHAALARAAEVQSTRLKRENARASLDDLRLARELGRLVLAEDVERTWTTAVGNMAQQLDKLPQQVLPHAVRLAGRMLEQVGVPANKSAGVAGAVEELKTLLEQELVAAVETVKQKLHQMGADDHGQGQDDE